MDKEYLEKRLRQLKMQFRVSFGFSQIMKRPVTALLFVFLIAGCYLFMWKLRMVFFSILDMPPLFSHIVEFAVTFLVCVFPTLLMFFIFEQTGELMARKDEAALMVSFNKEELKYGCPVLIRKKISKDSGLIERVFFSPMSKETWEKKADVIAEKLSEHIPRNGGISYSGDRLLEGWKIRLRTLDGLERKNPGNLYDEEF